MSEHWKVSGGYLVGACMLEPCSFGWCLNGVWMIVYAEKMSAVYSIGHSFSSVTLHIKANIVNVT